MAVDYPDWTQPVNVVAGSVAISGVATVTISGTPTVSISGTPTVNIGTAPTITVTGTVNVGNTPAVTVSGTVSVSIVAGTVNIGGTPTINVVSANGVNIQGPNLLPAAMQGPILGGWLASQNLNAIAFNADGTMTLTATAAGDAHTDQGSSLTGPFALLKVKPGEIYRLNCNIKGLTRANTAAIAARGFDASGTSQTFATPGSAVLVVNSYVAMAGNWTVPDGVYFLRTEVFTQAFGTGQAGDQAVVDYVSVQNIGAFPMNAQQGEMPARIHVNVVDSVAVVNGPAGSQVFVDFAAVAGKSYVAQFVVAALINTGPGAATGAGVGVFAGANTLTANAVWFSATGVTGTLGDKDHIDQTDIGAIVAVGSACRVGFQVGNAGIFESISAGVYLV